MYLFSCSLQKMLKVARVLVTRLSACAFVPLFFQQSLWCISEMTQGEMDAICLIRKKRTLYDVIFASCVSYMRQDHSRTPYGIIGV